MKSIRICEDSLPKAWESAVTAVWRDGSSFPTQYDHAGDPESKDCTMMVHITNPMAEPRIHKALPLGLNDLEKYRLEMITGCHDYFMDDLSNLNRWKYTYFGRLREHKLSSGLLIDQIEKCVEMLKKCGHTRRARAVTWIPEIDLSIEDPPCLQSIALRIENNNKLNMSIFFRSNDLFKAFYSNAFVFIELQSILAERLGVSVGDYIHVSESMHLYGSYFKEIENFIDRMGKTKFKDRVWSTKECTPFFIDGCNELLAEEDMPEDKRKLVEQRKHELDIAEVADQLSQVKNDPNLTIVTGLRHEYDVDTKKPCGGCSITGGAVKEK